MFCFNCGKEIADNVKFCPECGAKLSNDESSTPDTKNVLNNKVLIIVLSSVIFVLICVLAVFFLMSNNNSNEENTVSAGTVKTTKNKPQALPCDDAFVKDEVVSIFKQNNVFLPYIAENTIESITVQNPVAVAYDPNIDRYDCEATVLMTSSEDAFVPLDYNEHNYFYMAIKHNGVMTDYSVDPYNSYRCRVSYSSSISEGKPYVRSTSCSSLSDDDKFFNQ